VAIVLGILRANRAVQLAIGVHLGPVVSVAVLSDGRCAAGGIGRIRWWLGRVL
jgi:class 3 adenylate cyclase